MKIGYFAIGIGVTCEPEMIALIARTLEDCGFHSLWAPEHVVLLDAYASKYPYSKDGRLPIPTQVDILDPFAALNFAAAHTERIRLGTGICLVPERQPLVLAKEVASLDRLSKGRFDFGVGIGWLEEEFRALGIPWEHRAQRTREYLAAMKVLWTEEEPEFRGEFVSFPKLRSHPKPVQKPHPPIIFGGESAPALKRVAEIGDGWFGANVDAASAKPKIAKIRELAKAAGRNPDDLSMSAAPPFGTIVSVDELQRYRDAGTDQVVVGAFPGKASEVKPHIEKLAEAVLVPASRM
jgi:probable F420-dependent oxidoreductase